MEDDPSAGGHSYAHTEEAVRQVGSEFIRFADKSEDATRWEPKFADPRPFETIEFEVEATGVRRSSLAYSYGELKQRFEDTDQKIVNWFESQGQLQVALAEYERFYVEEAPRRSYVDQLAYSMVPTPELLDLLGAPIAGAETDKSQEGDVTQEVLLDFDFEEGQYISDETMKRLWGELQTLVNELKDNPPTVNPFMTFVGSPAEELADFLDEKPRPLAAGGFSGLSTEERQAVYGHFRNKYLDICAGIIGAWSDFLEYRGLPMAAQHLRTATDSAEARQALRAEFERSQDLLDLNGRIDDLAGRIKQALPDERRRLSGELAELKRQKLDHKHLLHSSIDLFDIERLVGEHIARQVRNLQADLGTSNEGQEKVRLLLDGRLDPEKDDDPGELTDDCTKGEPLPFDVPGLPVYNIKVYDQERDEHIGNIYMIELQTTDRETAWHLEAVQVMHGSIDWRSFGERLTEALAPAAKRKRVNVITINTRPEHVSNFDYVHSAMLAFAHHRGLNDGPERADIIYPAVTFDSYHATYQGDGTAFVIWRNDEIYRRVRRQTD